MKRKERRRLAMKLAKKELKKLGMPRRQLPKLRFMFQNELKNPRKAAVLVEDAKRHHVRTRRRIRKVKR